MCEWDVRTEMAAYRLVMLLSNRHLIHGSQIHVAVRVTTHRATAQTYAIAYLRVGPRTIPAEAQELPRRQETVSPALEGDPSAFESCCSRDEIT